MGTSFTYNGRLHLMSVIRDITEPKRALDRVGRLHSVAAALSEALTPADVARVAVEQGINEMRKIASLPAGCEYVRAMIYDSPEGVYVFLYDSADDAPCVADEWYETLADAEAACEQRFGVVATEWTAIDDPQAGCQHDWLRPTRVKADAGGQKLWGQFEEAT